MESGGRVMGLICDLPDRNTSDSLRSNLFDIRGPAESRNPAEAGSRCDQSRANPSARPPPPREAEANKNKTEAKQRERGRFGDR